MTVAIGNRQFLDHVDVVSPNFFQEIQLPLVAGNPATVFAQPESAVITESAARKYFGDASRDRARRCMSSAGCEFGPKSRAARSAQADVLVTGVVRDLPHNTQLTGESSSPIPPPPIPCRREESRIGSPTAAMAMCELAPGADPSW